MDGAPPLEGPPSQFYSLPLALPLSRQEFQRIFTAMDGPPCWKPQTLVVMTSSKSHCRCSLKIRPETQPLVPQSPSSFRKPVCVTKQCCFIIWYVKLVCFLETSWRPFFGPDGNPPGPNRDWAFRHHLPCLHSPLLPLQWQKRLVTIKE